MFGKPYGDYVRFQKTWLILIAVVGFARLALSIYGVPDMTVRFFSMNVVGVVALFYYGLRVGPSGFGSYRHLLPLVFNQNFLTNAIVVLGIALSAMGKPNIFDAPEYRPPFGQPSPMNHALAHLLLANIAGTLVQWGFTSLVMLIGGRPRRTLEAA